MATLLFIVLLICYDLEVNGIFDFHSPILRKALTRVSSSIPSSEYDLPHPDAIVNPPSEVKQYHGTTTIGFVYGDSVILCVDSKASIGNYVGSRTVKKILPITDSVIATMAGGAADCGYWIREVSKTAKLLEFENGGKLRVSMVARLLANKLREYRGKGLSVGTMVAGVDSNGPSIHYVDSEGSCVEGPLFCVGSGANLAYSILDAAAIGTSDIISKGISGLCLESAIDTALWAVRHATVRDGFSGGIIQVVQVNATGIHLIRRIDSKTLSVKI